MPFSGTLTTISWRPQKKLRPKQFFVPICETTLPRKEQFLGTTSALKAERNSKHFSIPDQRWLLHEKPWSKSCASGRKFATFVTEELSYILRSTHWLYLRVHELLLQTDDLGHSKSHYPFTTELHLECPSRPSPLHPNTSIHRSETISTEELRRKPFKYGRW